MVSFLYSSCLHSGIYWLRFWVLRREIFSFWQASGWICAHEWRDVLPRVDGQTVIDFAFLTIYIFNYDANFFD